MPDYPFEKFHEACLRLIITLRESKPDPDSPRARMLARMEAAEEEYSLAKFKLADSVTKR